MINIRDNKLEKMIDEILKRTHYSSSIEYLEDRIKMNNIRLSIYQKVRSTSIEQMPTLFFFVVSTDLNQQMQEQTKSENHTT